MKHPIKILINSFYKNSQAVSHLMKGMRKNKNFNNFQFIICVGGHTELSEYKVTARRNVASIKCPHNSIDFTGIVTVAENQHRDLFNDSDYYFYLHDTCAVGPNFLSHVSNIDISNNPLGIPLLRRYAKNIGVYSNKLILQHRGFATTRLKNKDNNLAMEYKKKGISWEDLFFTKKPGRSVMNTSLINPKQKEPRVVREGPVDYYKTGTLRDVFYWPSLDLYKIQANNKHILKSVRNNAVLDL